MKHFYFLLFCSVLLPTKAVTITTQNLPAPANYDCGDAKAKLNNVLFGATPPNASPNQPVIVFVHGWFDNGYSWFMAKNQWYQKCYNAGYNTAFFFHTRSGLMQENGAVIADMIRATCEHFNTNNVIAVCHSKGGLDMEFALYNSGIADSVSGVITLSSPFYGAALGDFIANPLIKLVTENIPIVGEIFRGKGTYQLQTAYMTGVVRPMMDNSAENRPEKFRCFGAWGFNNIMRFPPNIPDDIAKVVFYEQYRPLCFDIPGLGVIAGGLMTAGFTLLGGVSKIIPIPSAYQYPNYDNNKYTDGLVSYYSAFRPGATEVSERPPSTNSFLNHVDVLLSSETWDEVYEQIQYCTQNPVLRKANQASVPTNKSYQRDAIASNYNLLKTKTLPITVNRQTQLQLIGNYNNLNIKIYNNNQLIKTIQQDLATDSYINLFHSIDLSDLNENTNYTLEFNQAVTALFVDGNEAALSLAFNQNYATNTDLNSLKIYANNFNANYKEIQVEAILNRNMDEFTDVVYESSITIPMIFNQQEQCYQIKEIPNLKNGIYNLTIVANTKTISRTLTTSIAINKNEVLNKNSKLYIYPNIISNNDVQLKYYSAVSKNDIINIYNLEGKLIFQQAVNLQAGENQLTLNTSNVSLAKGIYIVQLNESSAKIIKQ
ncbi:MAG: T9SS type A sorting domain-containing protein [Chitinophagales bacterium]|nr:T9SS type A sorting domain-containing protein [Chitinophagales bacterium]